MDLLLIGVLVIAVFAGIVAIGIVATWLHDRRMLKKGLAGHSKTAEDARTDAKLRLENARTQGYRDALYSEGPHGRRQI
jgi:hypothetical protein